MHIPMEPNSCWGFQKFHPGGIFIATMGLDLAGGDFSGEPECNAPWSPERTSSL